MNSYLSRKFIIGGIFSLLILVYMSRLFFLQVIDQSSKLSASNNVLRYVTQFPSRGLIYDRNGTLLVYNEAAYDLMVIPNQVESFDTTQLCQLLRLTKEQVESRLQKAKSYSRYKPSVFENQLLAKTYAPLQEKLYMFKGFFTQTRTLRRYPERTAAHIVGYVGEVNEKTAKTKNYYRSGDYIGISGVEKSYEDVLRGEKGVEIFMVDVHNRIKGQYKKGKYDTAAVHGGNIELTLDNELQKYGEQLMDHKLGSIVALEPSTGEILAIVSSPSYNSELLVGRERSEHYLALQNDTLKPLLDRALMAQYPPGSTFKPVNALIGLQEDIIKPWTTFPCLPGYAVGRFYMGCHNHVKGLNVVGSIQHSCNAYYASLYRKLLDDPKYGNIENAFELWRNYVLSFGFGKSLGVDLPHEVNGYVPTLNFYNRIYGEGRLRSLYIVSNAIGQGELLMTPVQMANMAAIICNKGYYYTPHIIKELPSEFNNKKMPYLVQRYANIDSALFEYAIEGMYKAVNGEDGGTARIARFKDLDICGKTGTAQNPHGENHSIFIAFAPRDNPQIAISVYVENSGAGSSWAAPIASLMIEKYLTDTVSRGWLELHVNRKEFY
ncbi:MAG: penicillin-binding protein 2 [Salinivirgaceae bacterium]|jgi:penicillin-binding protein 2|nr:penicillin-binding protein 2 [Salinivirgaceae bacterium]